MSLTSSIYLSLYKQNGKKYPAGIVKGKSAKYNEYDTYKGEGKVKKMEDDRKVATTVKTAIDIDGRMRDAILPADNNGWVWCIALYLLIHLPGFMYLYYYLEKQNSLSP